MADGPGATNKTGVEINFIGNYPRPAEWGVFRSAAGDAAEIEVDARGKREEKDESGNDVHWSPTTEYLRIIGKTPGDTFEVLNNKQTVGGLFGAILNDKDGKTRPKKSVRRVNIISHGRSGLIGLDGTVSKDGVVRLGASVAERPGDPDSPMESTAIDQSVIDWLNGNAQSVRDDVREKFTDNADILLFLCDGGSAAGLLMLNNLATALGVLIRAYKQPVHYMFEFKNGRITNRNLTATSATSEHKAGYPTTRAVGKDQRGEHMTPNVVAVPVKQPKP
jgi:hypothetical protein